MNQLIADNSVLSLKRYLSETLTPLYDERERGNIVAELFYAYSGWSRTDLALNGSQRLTESEILKYHFAAKRLKSGEPIQYVLGYAWFCGRKFNVANDVLIPRPETEELVHLVTKSCSIAEPTILDIGTGSGCIAISLKLAIPHAQVMAVDISREALLIATKNANQLQADVDFKICDILHETPIQKFDIIVSNPPYIALSEKSEMSKQVVDHEPHLALFVPDDNSLIFYERLIQLAPDILREGGQFYCEIHEQMQQAIVTLFEKYAIVNYQFQTDLQGKNRMVSFCINQ